MRKDIGIVVPLRHLLQELSAAPIASPQQKASGAEESEGDEGAEHADAGFEAGFFGDWDACGGGGCAGCGSGAT